MATPDNSVFDLLGGSSVLGVAFICDCDWWHFVNEGLPLESARFFQGASGLSDDQLSLVLGTSLASIAGSRLSLLQGERLWRAATLFARALQVFGSKQKALKWLSTKKKKLLAGAVPLALVESQFGSEHVLFWLDCLDLGYAS